MAKKKGGKASSSKPETKKAVGRPPEYREEYAEQARKLCLLGATDKELADFFNVSERTINNWKTEIPEFLQSIQSGKVLADAEVAEKLFQRAKGYSHEEDKFFQYEGQVIIQPTTKHYPPDTAAAFIWLKNRQSGKWRDKPADDGEDDEVVPVKVEVNVMDARKPGNADA